MKAPLVSCSRAHYNTPSMLLVLRKLFFYLLLGLYLVITPSVIFYALGYMIDPAEIGFYKTGLVSVVTEPKNAALYVSGRKFSSPTPTAIHDLLPGRYHVRLVRKGYLPWEKEIPIQTEKATRLESVLLLPLKPEIETVSARAYQNFIPEIEDFKVYAWETPSLASLRRIDLIFKNEAPVGTKLSAAENMKILKMIHKDGSGLALFEIEKENVRSYVALDLGQGKLTELDALSRFLPEHIVWDSRDSSRLYALKDNSVAGAGLRGEKLYPVETGGPVRGFGAKHNRLYFLRKDFSLFETNRAGEAAKDLFEKNESVPLIFKGAESPFYRIESYRRDIFQKDLFLFFGNQGELRSNWPPYLIVKTGVLGVRYATSGDEEKILFWTRNEIGEILFRKESETAFDKVLSARVIYRAGKDIRQAFWVYEDSHILFRDGNRMQLIEVKNEEPYLVREVGIIAPDTDIYYDKRSRMIYFLDPGSRNLVKRKITD